MMSDERGEEHSDAYDRLVRPDDNGAADIVGLLAYAHYKSDKRELARSGKLDERSLRSHHRTLTDNLVEQYRDSALRSLEAYATEVVERTIPEVQEATRTEAVVSAKEAILQEVRSIGSPGWSILWNVIAWFITLAITFLVAVGSGAVNLTIAPK